MVCAAAIACGVAMSGITDAHAQSSTVDELRNLIEGPLVTTCSPEFLVVVPGGGGTVPGLSEKLPRGSKVTDIARNVRDRSRGTVQPVWVSYPAVPFAVMPYPESERKGREEMIKTVRRLARMCPRATFSFTGYSEGAGIASMVINDIAYGRGPIPAERFNSASLVSNPRLGDNGGAFYGGAGPGNKGALGVLHGGYGQLGSRVIDVCRADDPICALPYEWQHHVDPLLRIVIFRGQMPLMDILSVLTQDLSVSIPFVSSFRNHTLYGHETYHVGSQWILERRGPARVRAAQ